MMKGDLTLAICMYNAEKYIAETLQSVLAQTMQGFQLLILDDCSTDDSRKKVNDFFAVHKRQYELVVLEENRGICYARHYVERYASTKYLMFLDADDILYPEAVETMYGIITGDADLMAVGCYLEYIDEQNRKIGGGLFLGETTKEAFREKAARAKLIFMQPTAIYEREMALRVGGYVIDGFPEGKPRYRDYCEDLDLWTRMSDLYTEGKAIVVVPKVLCKYRKTNGLSASSYNMSLKMKYTKTNLLRRRKGLPDYSFIEFQQALTVAEYKEIRNCAGAADALRNGAFYLRKHHFLKGVCAILTSIWLKPGYIVDKFKNNVCR